MPFRLSCDPCGYSGYFNSRESARNVKMWHDQHKHAGTSTTTLKWVDEIPTSDPTRCGCDHAEEAAHMTYGEGKHAVQVCETCGEPVKGSAEGDA